MESNGREDVGGGQGTGLRNANRLTRAGCGAMRYTIFLRLSFTLLFCSDLLDGKEPRTRHYASQPCSLLPPLKPEAPLVVTYLGHKIESYVIQRRWPILYFD